MCVQNLKSLSCRCFWTTVYFSFLSDWAYLYFQCNKSVKYSIYVYRIWLHEQCSTSSLSYKCAIGLLYYCKYRCLCSPGGNSHPCQEKEGRAQQHFGCNEKGCCQEGVTCIIGQINLYSQIYSFACVFFTIFIIACLAFLISDADSSQFF